MTAASSPPPLFFFRSFQISRVPCFPSFVTRFRRRGPFLGWKQLHALPRSFFAGATLFRSSILRERPSTLARLAGAYGAVRSLVTTSCPCPPFPFSAAERSPSFRQRRHRPELRLPSVCMQSGLERHLITSLRTANVFSGGFFFLSVSSLVLLFVLSFAAPGRFVYDKPGNNGQCLRSGETFQVERERGGVHATRRLFVSAYCALSERPEHIHIYCCVFPQPRVGGHAVCNYHQEGKTERAYTTLGLCGSSVFASRMSRPLQKPWPAHSKLSVRTARVRFVFLSLEYTHRRTYLCYTDAKLARKQC